MPPSITYHTTSPAEWTGIGIDLTAAQVDRNFFNVVQSIVDLENDRPEPNNIANISVSGVFMTITLDDGQEIGPLQLPVLQYHWRNDWAPNTLYLPLDTFKVDGFGLYSVLIEHTSDADEFDESAVDEDDNPLYFKLFGTDGSGPAAASKYIISGYLNGLMSANLNILYHKVATDITFPADFEDYLQYSSGIGSVAAPSADVTIAVGFALAGSPTSFTTFGFLHYDLASTTWSMTTASHVAVDIPAGSLVRVRAPSGADTTMAGFFFTLVARET